MNYVLENWFWIVTVGIPAVAPIIAWIKSYRAQGAVDHRELTLKRPPIKMTAAEVIAASHAAVLAYPQKGERNAREWRNALRERAKQHGLELVRTYSSSGIDVALFAFGETHILAIRGTCGAFDVVRDCLSYAVQGPIEGLAHAGFLGDAWRIYTEFQAELRDSPRMILAGHSMGAAEAIETAAVCCHKQVEIAGVVALCAPRSGKKSHAAALTQVLGDRLVRVTVSRDFVCMVPLHLFGWRHVGRTDYFDANGDYHPDLTVGFRLADVLGATVRDALKLRLLRDLLGYHSGSHAAELVTNNIEQFNLLESVDVEAAV